jgi:hypothetical protein
MRQDYACLQLATVIHFAARGIKRYSFDERIMKILIALCMLLNIAVSAQAQVATNVPDDKVLATLTNGMTAVEIQTILGVPGRPRENAPCSILEFDFEGLSIWVEFDSRTTPERATTIKIKKDGISVAKRQEARSKAWKSYLEAHQKTTNKKN